MCSCKILDYTHRDKHNYTLHWSFGNAKLVKDNITSFNIPAFRSTDGFATCPEASTCALVCYARQGHYMMPNVQKPREHNLAFLRENSMLAFAKTAADDIMHLHPNWKKVRIHDSGDFFSRSYLLAWTQIARFCPYMEFYAYTKMITLLNSIRPSLPENLHIIQSVGGKEDRFIDPRYAHSIIFPTMQALQEAGYVDGTKSDAPAYNRAVKIGLTYHGVRHLSENITHLLTAKAVKAMGWEY